MNDHLNMDPYDFKMPCRKDLMSLSKINPYLDSQKRRLDHTTKQDHSLQTHDIAGAQSYLKGYRFTQKPSFQNQTQDIPGATAQSFYSKRMRTESEKEEIKGTRPQINKFVTRRPSTNPLEPKYKLQSYVQRQPSPPRFLKDALRVDDIPGTRSKWLEQPQFTRKTVYQPGHIAGSTTRQQWIPKDRMDVLDVKDINQYLQYKSSRQVDPLEPTYRVNDESAYGTIDGSKSRQLHPKVMKVDKNYSLKTGDILGAQHGTTKDAFLKTETRKDFRNTNLTKDIPGAQQSTLRKGMQTKRQTNPNCPLYQTLGGQAEQQHQASAIRTMNSEYKMRSTAQKLDSFIT